MLPPSANHKNTRWNIVRFFTVALVILVIIGSIWLITNRMMEGAVVRSAQETKTATDLTSTALESGAKTALAAQTQTQTTTVKMLSPLNPDPFFKKLAYYDPMTRDNGNWEKGLALDGAGSCEFQEDGFNIDSPEKHVKKGDFIFVPLCRLNKTFSDFSFLTQVTIFRGDCAVLAFNDPSSSPKDQKYQVYICQNGYYHLTASKSSTSVEGVSKAIKQGYNVTNTVGISVHNSVFTLFINNRKLGAVQIKEEPGGETDVFYNYEIGLSVNASKEWSTVAFRDIAIWTA